MADPRITDEAVEAAERAYVEHWRDRVPAAGAGMRAALEAALPHLAPQPVDREAVFESLRGKGIVRDPNRPDWRGGLSEDELGDIADAVLALLDGTAK